MLTWEAPASLSRSPIKERTMKSTAKGNGNGNGTAVPGWHAEFLSIMPAIRRHARSLFRRLPRQDRDEAVAEVTAVAMMEYLNRRDGDRPECLDPAILATSAVLNVRHSGRACGRESNRDVLSPTAQRRRGFLVEHLRESCDAERQRARIDLRGNGDPNRLCEARTHGQGGRSRFAREQRRRRAEKRLDANKIEFAAARRIQERLLPVAPPDLACFDVGGIARPAAATGGDYFDYVPMLNGAVGVVIGDVSGHGFGPALLIASTRAYVRAFAQTSNDPAELLALTNRVLTADTADERFVTLVLARLDTQQSSLVYASAGHPTAYILDAAGRVRMRLPSTGLPLGISPENEFVTSPTISVGPGELVLLVSDGVLEACAPDGGPFGWSRAVGIARIYRAEPAACIVSNLYHAVRAYAQNAPQLDDITAVVIKRRVG
jgi:serine phosphatase RsbU (regulator of sigma subunit)